MLTSGDPQFNLSFMRQMGLGIGICEPFQGNISEVVLNCSSPMAGDVENVFNKIVDVS